MVFLKNLNFHFSNYGKFIFWSIIIGFAFYRSFVWVNYFTKSYDCGLAMDFKNIYIASKNLGLGKDPYNEAALFATWQNELLALDTSHKDPPGDKDHVVLYPPWALWMFLPFTFLPYLEAVQLFHFILFLSLLSIPWLLQLCIQGKFEWTNYIGILLLLIAFKGMKLSVLFGQPSIFIFAAGLGAWYFYNLKNGLVSGLLLGLASIKPSIGLVFYIALFTFGAKNLFTTKKKHFLLPIILFIACLLPIVGLYFAEKQSSFHEESLLGIYLEKLTSFSTTYYSRGFNDNYNLDHTTDLRVLFCFWNNITFRNLSWIEPVLLIFSVLISIWQKCRDRWSDQRFLTALIGAFLCFTYHLYYELAWLVIIYFLFKNEITPPFQWLVLIVCIPDFLIGMEKITPYVPSAISQFLNSWNFIELPIRMISLWVILLIYPSKKQLDFAT